ncbi:hypothetical protein HDU67_008658 [Dinochytrium kinnereticum]|nr:hypothetical protein HDU67_008658 [Dinochytrium kinnereticum]
MSATPQAKATGGHLLSIPGDVLVSRILSRLAFTDIAAVIGCCKALKSRIDQVPDAFWRWKCGGLVPSKGALLGFASSRAKYRKLSHCIRFGPSASVPFGADWTAPHLDLGEIDVCQYLRKYSAGVSVDVWFKCLPEMTSVNGTRYAGGVILGCQSGKVASKSQWPHNHWQVFFIDSEGRLRAALDSVAHRHILGPQVADGCWHHAIIIATEMEQTLYVDGQLTGSLAAKISASNYSLLAVWQVGNGVISGGVEGKPSADWNDAYPFNGIVQSVHLRGKAYSASEVKNIFNRGIKGIEEPQEHDVKTFLPQLQSQKTTSRMARVPAKLVHEEHLAFTSLPSFKLKDETYSYGSVILSKLPYEIGLYRILASLTYPEILKMASLSKEQHAYLSDISDDYWKFRCAPYHVNSEDSDTESPWIERYGYLSRCIVFGPKPDTSEGKQTFWQPIDDAFDFLRRADGRLTVEAWIKCYRAKGALGVGAYQGGIIFGTQSGSILRHESGYWPHYHWQPLMVGGDGQIRGSFDSDQHVHIVGPNVVDGIWHHVLLTCDTAEQKLYVDGIKVGSLPSSVSLQSHRLMNDAQIGTGIISGTTDGRPLEVWNAAFPFHGIIRDFKLTARSFTDDDAKSAAALPRYSGPDRLPARDTSVMLPVHSPPPPRIIQRPPYHIRPIQPRPRPLIFDVDDQISNSSFGRSEATSGSNIKSGGSEDSFNGLEVVAAVPGRPTQGVAGGLNAVSEYGEVLYVPLCGRVRVSRELQPRVQWTFDHLPLEQALLRTAML